MDVLRFFYVFLLKETTWHHRQGFRFTWRSPHLRRSMDILCEAGGWWTKTIPIPATGGWATYGYGSIPIDTFLGDEHPFTSYFEVNYRGTIGFDPSPYYLFFPQRNELGCVPHGHKSISCLPLGWELAATSRKELIPQSLEQHRKKQTWIAYTCRPPDSWIPGLFGGEPPNEVARVRTFHVRP